MDLPQSPETPNMTRRGFIGAGAAATGALLAAREFLPSMLEAQQEGVEALSDKALYEAVFGEAQELLDQYSAQLVEQEGQIRSLFDRMGFSPEAAVEMEQDDMHRYAEGFFERLAEAETLDDMEFGPEDYAFASSKIGTPTEEAPEGPPGPIQESGELTEHSEAVEGHGRDGFLNFYDAAGTAYFGYALGKLIARSSPDHAKKVTEKRAERHGIPVEEQKPVEPHFNRYDFMTTLTVLGASRLRAKEIGDAEQVHHIDEHVKEAVVASAKVGLDILLSIGISKMTEPFIEHRLDELKNKYAGDPNGYQKALYRNIHGLATVGSGLLSTNLGVSFARTMLREYSTVRHQGGGQINGPDGEPLTYANGNPVYGRYAKGEGGEILHDEDGMPIIHEDGDPVVDEEGRPVIDWKKFYYNVATVADLTGDAAISFHPLIASGDIAPREVVQQKIGWDNLHKVSLNAVPKRVFNTLVGFKMPNKVFNFLARRRHEKTPVDVNGADDIMFTREELEAFTERTNGFERAYRKAFEGHPSRLREAFRNSGRHKVESVQENFQDQADRLHDIWKVYVQDFKNSVKKGDQENVVDVSDELVPGHKGRTHVDQYGGLTLLADMAKKIPGVGPHVGPALHMLEQMSHLPVNFKTVHHAAGSTLAEALNLLPYQLLNAAPTSGVVHHMLNDLRISEPEPKTWKDSSIGELFMQNASMHLILEVLSGVADNGFSVSVGLNTIISDTRKLLEEGKTQEASDYFTLETQKIFDAGQAGGGGGLPGCSAHFNALSFSDIPMLETYKVGTPSFLGLYLAANAISATLAKNGLMPARLDMSPVAAASGGH